jgi:NAD dependent epimerase/dehydratase family enzyme
VLPNETLNGPINMVAPNAVTNREFTKALGSVLFRPTILPLPALVIRLLFGEMADALLLSSQRVKPTKLVESGYIFQQPNIEIVLRQLLRRL